MQYFIDFKEFQNERPFDPILLISFKKRFPEEAMNRIIEKMFIRKAEDKDLPEGGSSSGGTADDNPKEGSEKPNRGALIIDARCALVDIVYPTDLELCDRAKS